tara:strand:+ start:1022 stop:1612 length:591 start_codon:yes stop_codon:yes gene_type:complete
MITQLPIFKGYYNNPFTEDIEDYEFEYINDERVNNNKKPFKNDELFEYDYENYFKELSESLCYKVWDILEDFIREIKFIKLESPEYYNYSNDIIICDIKPNKKMIKTYIKNNYKNWAKYLKDNFTSYDGFISYYSNDENHEDWNINNILNNEEHSNKLEYILDFIAINEGINENEIYEDNEVYLSVKNYNELIERV